MKPDKPPVIVDLQDHRKRKARDAADARKIKRVQQRREAHEPLLGARPKAGLILALVVAVAIALWLAPRLF